MGLALILDDEPRIRAVGHVGDDRVDGEHAVWEVEGWVEAARFGARMELRMTSVPLEPPLSDEAAAARLVTSYNGFGAVREELAATIGVNLDVMVGYGGHTPWDTVDSPLVPLLHHSDAEGDLGPQECAAIAPAVREAAPRLPVNGEWALRLADIMELAASFDRRLLFR